MLQSNMSFFSSNLLTVSDDSSPVKMVNKSKSQSIFLGKLFRKKMQPLSEDMPEIKALVIGKENVGKSLFISKMIVSILCCYLINKYKFQV